jgi:hypothetical protein
MARFGLENIDRDFFWELVDEGYGEWRGIEDAYLYMMSKKLSKDTDINFRVENGYLYNDEIEFKIPTSTITTYDNLLKDIEKFLSENAQENEFGIDTNKLANQWAYTFSHTEMSPYYEGDGSELTALYSDHCTWMSIFKTAKGTISVSMTSESKVLITYQDKINQEIAVLMILNKKLLIW